MNVNPIQVTTMDANDSLLSVDKAFSRVLIKISTLLE